VLPAYFTISLICYKVIQWFGDGPLSGHLDHWHESCEESFWDSMTLMNNLYSEKLRMCAGWGWYLASDFQMFLTAPIIIYVLQKSRKGGFLLITLLVAQYSNLAIGIRTEMGALGWHFPGSGQSSYMEKSGFDFFRWFYMAPW